MTSGREARDRRRDQWRGRGHACQSRCRAHLLARRASMVKSPSSSAAGAFAIGRDVSPQNEPGENADVFARRTLTSSDAHEMARRQSHPWQVGRLPVPTRAVRRRVDAVRWRRTADQPDRNATSPLSSRSVVGGLGDSTGGSPNPVQPDHTEAKNNATYSVPAPLGGLPSASSERGCRGRWSPEATDRVRPCAGLLSGGMPLLDCRTDGSNRQNFWCGLKVTSTPIGRRGLPTAAMCTSVARSRRGTPNRPRSIELRWTVAHQSASSAARIAPGIRSQPATLAA